MSITSAPMWRPSITALPQNAVTSGSNILPLQPPHQASALGAFNVGQAVHVWSSSDKGWITDALITEVKKDSGSGTCLLTPVGSVKVVYSDGGRTKWVQPNEFGTRLRAAEGTPKATPSTYDAMYEMKSKKQTSVNPVISTSMAGMTTTISSTPSSPTKGTLSSPFKEPTDRRTTVFTGPTGYGSSTFGSQIVGTGTASVSDAGAGQAHADLAAAEATPKPHAANILGSRNEATSTPAPNVYSRADMAQHEAAQTAPGEVCIGGNTYRASIEVDVFSNTSGQWHRALVTDASGEWVTVNFAMPSGTSVRKQFSHTNCDQIRPTGEGQLQYLTKYKCPGCSEVVDSCEAALRHCGGDDVDTSPTASTRSSDGRPQQPQQQQQQQQQQPGNASTTAAPASEAPAPSMPPQRSPEAIAAARANPAPAGETIAYDGAGNPIVVRELFENGEGRTTVVNEDGTHHVFSKNTIHSLLQSEEEHAEVFLQKLTDMQMRGLAHEFGQRLMSTSQVYEFFRKQIEQIYAKRNFEYFDLDENATPKDLDNAYKKKAKQMHPDRNGGSERAKEDFQKMQERYKALKRILCPEDEEEEKKKKDTKKEDGDNEDDEDKEPKRKKEAYDEDDPEDTPEGEEDEDDESKIAYDPNSRKSMDKTVRKMLGQLKTLEISKSSMQKELSMNGKSYDL